MDKTSAAAVRITDPQLLRFFPDINAVLGGKSLDDYRGRGRRALALSHRQRLRAARLADNTTGGFGWQLNGVTSLDVDYVHDYATDQLGATDATCRRAARSARPTRGRCRNSARSTWSRTSARAGTTRSRCSCGRACAAPTTCRCPTRYSKSWLDGVTFYSTVRGTERTPQQDGYNPTDTPHNLSVAASTDRCRGSFS